MKQVLIVEDQRMPRENMERVISESDNYTLSASVNGAVGKEEGGICYEKLEIGTNM